MALEDYGLDAIVARAAQRQQARPSILPRNLNFGAAAPAYMGDGPLADEMVQRDLSRYNISRLALAGAGGGAALAAANPGFLSMLGKVFDYAGGIGRSAAMGVANLGIKGIEGATGLDIEQYDPNGDGVTGDILGGIGNALKGGQVKGFGDQDALGLKFEADDSRRMKALKGAGAFVFDSAFDPLTYVSLGSGSLGKTATKELAQEGAKKLAQEGLEKAGREAAERVLRNDRLFVDAARSTMQIADEDAAVKAFLGSMDDTAVFARAGESVGYGTAAAYQRGGSTGLRKFMEANARDFGADDGRALFRAMPTEVRGGIMLSAPFGKTAAVPLSEGGGLTLERIAGKRVGAIGENLAGLRNLAGASAPGRVLGRALGGRAGEEKVLTRIAARSGDETLQRAAEATLGLSRAARADANEFATKVVEQATAARAKDQALRGQAGLDDDAWEAMVDTQYNNLERYKLTPGDVPTEGPEALAYEAAVVRNRSLVDPYIAGRARYGDTFSPAGVIENSRLVVTDEARKLGAEETGAGSFLANTIGKYTTRDADAFIIKDEDGKFLRYMSPREANERFAEIMGTDIPDGFKLFEESLAKIEQSSISTTLSRYERAALSTEAQRRGVVVRAAETGNTSEELVTERIGDQARKWAASSGKASAQVVAISDRIVKLQAEEEAYAAKVAEQLFDLNEKKAAARAAGDTRLARFDEAEKKILDEAAAETKRIDDEIEQLFAEGRAREAKAWDAGEQNVRVIEAKQQALTDEAAARGKQLSDELAAARATEERLRSALPTAAATDTARAGTRAAKETERLNAKRRGVARLEAQRERHLSEVADKVSRIELAKEAARQEGRRTVIYDIQLRNISEAGQRRADELAARIASGTAEADDIARIVDGIAVDNAARRASKDLARATDNVARAEKKLADHEADVSRRLSKLEADKANAIEVAARRAADEQERLANNAASRVPRAESLPETTAERLARLGESRSNATASIETGLADLAGRQDRVLAGARSRSSTMLEQIGRKQTAAAEQRAVAEHLHRMEVLATMAMAATVEGGPRSAVVARRLELIRQAAQSNVDGLERILGPESQRVAAARDALKKWDEVVIKQNPIADALGSRSGPDTGYTFMGTLTDKAGRKLEVDEAVRNTFVRDEMAGAMSRAFEASQARNYDALLELAYKPLMSTWKTWATIGGGPAFWFRNNIGGMWNATLVGTKGGDFKLGARYVRETRAAMKEVAELVETAGPDVNVVDELERVFRERLSKHAVGDSNMWELHQKMRRDGIFGGTQTSIALDKPDATENMIAALLGQDRRKFLTNSPDTPGIERYRKFLSAVNDNGYMRLMAGGNEIVETYLRASTYFGGVRHFGADSVGPRLRTIASQFDYNDASRWEQRWLKDFALAPFFAFTKNNVPLQLRAIVNEPGKIAMALRLNDTTGKVLAADEDEAALNEYLPDYQREALGFVTGIHSGDNPIVAGLNLPLIDLNRFLPSAAAFRNPKAFVSQVVGGAEDDVTGMTNPFLKAGVERVTGVSSFTGAKFTDQPTTKLNAPLFRAFGATSIDPDTGEEVASGYVQSQLNNLLPPVGRLQRLLPQFLGNSRYEERGGLQQFNFVFGAGLPVAGIGTLTPSQVQGSLRTRTSDVERELDKRAGDLGLDPRGLRELIKQGVAPEDLVATAEAQGLVAPYLRGEQTGTVNLRSLPSLRRTAPGPAPRMRALPSTRRREPRRLSLG